MVRKKLDSEEFCRGRKTNSSERKRLTTEQTDAWEVHHPSTEQKDAWEIHHPSSNITQ